MKVPFYDFKALHNEAFLQEVLARFNQILHDNAFIEGNYNQQFENKLAKKLQANHALLVGNGTDALEISLKALGVSAGDYVGVPGITFVATAEAVLNVGARPIFIDVDDSGLIDVDSFSRMAQEYDLKAVIPVHIYGLPAPIKELEEIASKFDIKIIEDAAQAMGTFLLDGTPVGSTQNLTTFSFYPTKNLSTFGDAGAILTQDETLAKKITSLRNHGRGSTEFLGRNSRCDHMQAAVLDLKIETIDEQNSWRKEMACYYHQKLKGNFTLLPEKFLKSSSWHLYPVLCPSQEERISLQKFLADRDVSTAPFYDKALSQESALKNFRGEIKNAEKLAGRFLCLPIGPHLKTQDIDFIVTLLEEYFHGRSDL